MDVDVRLDPAALARALTGPNGAAFEAVQRATNRVLNLAIDECPRDTGRLVNSLTAEVRSVGGEPVGRVGSNLTYARMVHDGTGIYGPSHDVIRPRTASVLRWPTTNNSGSGRRRYKGGRTDSYTYARWVRGVPGRPFLLNALRRARL